jgi:hypothetical protein
VGSNGLLALVLAAALPVSERPLPPLDLAVQWFDTARELHSACGAVKKRVEEIFESASVRIHWTDTGQNVAPDAIAVILMPDPPSSVSPGAMGSMTDDDKRRFVYVYFNLVLKGAGLDGPVRYLSVDEEVMFSRALSRVIAHEIVHSLVRGGEHVESGIMSATLTPSML